MKCLYCEKNKHTESFRKNRRKCKDCEKEYGRKYYELNKNKRQKWTSENKERMKFLQARWYQNNKSHIRRKYNERYYRDVEFRLKKNLTRILTHNIVKDNPTIMYIGTEMRFIKSWIEYNMTDEMIWENYGSYWDIDHVIPIDLFDLSNNEEVNICFNWKNLMPYSKIKNIKKSNKLIPYAIFLQELKLLSFSQNDSVNMYINKYSSIFSKLYATLLVDRGTP